MRKTLFLIFVSVFLFSSSAFAQDPKVKAAPEKAETAKTGSEAAELTAKDYEQMVAKLKKRETDIDFDKLRRAYTKSKSFAPYGGGEERKSMDSSFEKGEFKQALSEAENYLENKNFADPYVLQVALITNSELGNKVEADFYKDVFVSLLKAMIDKTDGKTAENAIYCIGINEQYTLMNFLDFRSGGQSLMRQNGHTFDKHTAKNEETGEVREFWFNIDDVFGKFN